MPDEVHSSRYFSTESASAIFFIVFFLGFPTQSETEADEQLKQMHRHVLYSIANKRNPLHTNPLIYFYHQL